MIEAVDRWLLRRRASARGWWSKAMKLRVHFNFNPVVLDGVPVFWRS